MSSSVAIAAILVLTLAGGVVWYERSRPPAQVVALVAALAALAAAGRVALSPIPNVVPTTDIALIAGFTLGGPPGFAVGALAALASNFWLGQGPWTPWQMAGWGLTGLLGAALAAATGRKLGRVGLALACGFAGLAYGALLDLSVMVTYGGEQSLDRYLALSARGLPFNIAHAAGNVAFALVAGPALIRMLQRYRSRFEFAWKRGDKAPDPNRAGRAAAAGAAVLLLAVVLGASTASPQVATAGAADRDAVSYLRAAQNPDGGFGFSPDADSSAGMTGWAALGLEAAGVNPLDLVKGGATPISYLRANAGAISDAADLERTILVVEAAGLDARRFAGRNMVQRLLGQRRSDGSWGGQVNPTAFGVLALRAAGAGAAGGSSSWLVRNQNRDGGWGFAPGSSSDADTTGAVLQALAAAGVGAGRVNQGVGYLRSVQLGGGGFPLSGGGANAQSTAWAVQGLLAAGVSPRRLRRGGRDPLGYLASLQVPDGHYRYSSSSDQTPVWVTAQALQAVERVPFPIAQVSRSASGSGGSSPAGGAAGGSSAPGASGDSSAGPGAAGAVGGEAGGAGAGGVAGAAGAAAAAPQTAARYETEDDGDSKPLIAGIALGLLLVVGCGVLLHRREAGAPGA